MNEIKSFRHFALRSYKKILQEIPNIAVILSTSGEIIYLNPAGQKLTGYREEELQAEEWNRLFSIQSEPEFDIVNIHDKQIKCIAKTGEIIYISWKCAVLEDIDTDQKYIVCYGSDITEYTKALNNFNNSQKMLETTLQNMPGGMLLIDDAYIITQVNKRTCEITGYKEEELVGQFCDIVCPKGSESKECPIWEKGQKAFDGMDTTIKRKDGYRNPILKNAQTITIKNKNYILENFQDITEQKESQKALLEAQNYISGIINSMPSVIIGVDQDEKITQWNDIAQKATGIPRDNALGADLKTTFPEISKYHDKIQQSIATKTTNVLHKVQQETNQGIQYKDITIFPINETGFCGAVIRVDDITDRVHLEELLIQNEKMLSVGGLAAGMAHEIYNPLAGMIQTASVLTNRLSKNLNMAANLKAAHRAGTDVTAIKNFMEERDINRMLQNINESGRRIADIVDNMLNFSRKGSDSKTYCDIIDIIEKTLQLANTDYDLTKQQDFKKIKIQREYAPGLPEIQCNRTKLQQVFLNIFRNGAEAMHEANIVNPQFTIRVSENNSCVHIEIEDNGTGMDGETRRRIFEPFFTNKEVGKGTGLGMSVSFFIITEYHGGELTVESELDKGSVFSIKLPVSAE